MNEILVKKFGGSSLASLEHLESVAKYIQEKKAQHHKMVIVLSAMGDATDRLLDQVSTLPQTPEKDLWLSTGELQSCALFCMLIQKMGVAARVFTGFQVPIRTTPDVGQALIEWVNPQKMIKAFEDHDVIIVPGFQGVSGDQITTLGRGGSDLTAVALSIALGAKRCDIYTDVEGVMTTDPKLCASARLIKHIDYDQMIEFSYAGAKVLQGRCVTLAKRFCMPVRVCSSFTHNTGTLIDKGVNMENTIVSGVALQSQMLFVSAHVDNLSVENQKTLLSKAQVLSFEQQDNRKLSFLTHLDQKPLIEKQLDLSKAVLKSVSMVTVIGCGFRITPQVFLQVQDALKAVEVFTTFVSDKKVQCIVLADEGEKVVRILHETFGLQKEPN